MKLLTKEILARLPAIGSTSEQADPIAQVKFFDPTGSWSWFITEYNPATGEMFGLVHGHEKEIGYIDFNELSAFRGRFGLGIERDMGWKPRPLSEIK